MTSNGKKSKTKSKKAKELYFKETLKYYDLLHIS